MRGPGGGGGPGCVFLEFILQEQDFSGFFPDTGLSDAQIVLHDDIILSPLHSGRH